MFLFRVRRELFEGIFIWVCICVDGEFRVEFEICFSYYVVAGKMIEFLILC